MRHPARCAALLILATLSAAARADNPAAAPAAKPSRYTDLLAREADALIATAVKRPYGWGWTTADAADAPAKKGKPQVIPIVMEPAATPTAGLVLLYAADLLKEPRFADAARNVARGVAASQHSSGRVPEQALFGLTSAASKELLTPLPERGPTRAALALFLSFPDQDDPEKRDEPLARAGSRAAAWLLKQQAESGGCPILYPPGAAAKDSTRLVRLDTPDTRNSTCAMLLAYEAIGDPFQRRAAERALEFLLKARSGAGLPIGPGLWQSAYVLTGVPVDKTAEFPDGYDTLASRHAAQTFLAAWAILGEGPRLMAAELAVKSIDDLAKGDDGRWHRRYNFRGVALDNVAADAQPPSTFGTPDKPEAEATPSDPALALTAQTIAAARALGRKKFRERLNATFTPKQHLAQMIAGLSDHPMSADFPTVAEQVEPYLKRHAATFGLIDSPPADLAGKVKRLWAIYLRARIERQLGI